MQVYIMVVLLVASVPLLVTLTLTRETRQVLLVDTELSGQCLCKTHETTIRLCSGRLEDIMTQLSPPPPPPTPHDSTTVQPFVTTLASRLTFRLH